MVGSVAVQGLRSGPVGGDGQDLWGPQSPILYLATHAAQRITDEQVQASSATQQDHGF